MIKMVLYLLEIQDKKLITKNHSHNKDYASRLWDFLSNPLVDVFTNSFTFNSIMTVNIWDLLSSSSL